MLGQYETTFILTPVLSEDEAKKAINAYVELLKNQGAEIIHQEHWGLKNLRYPIQKKTTGIYHLVECVANRQPERFFRVVISQEPRRHLI